MARYLILAAALAATIPTVAQAQPVREGAASTRSESLRGNGVWIGALLFLAAIVAVVVGYSGGGEAPASP